MVNAFGTATLYDRIDAIHAQMVAFETFKLRKFRTAGWRRKRFALAKFKDELDKFKKKECDPSDDATTIRRAFIERHAVSLDCSAMGVQADWWTVPIQTMYEPDKMVGIVHQRQIGTDEETHQRKLDLLDRSSLHAVDSFFNVLRQRVSYFHRAGMSRSSGSFYNAHIGQTWCRRSSTSRGCTSTGSSRGRFGWPASLRP